MQITRKVSELAEIIGTMALKVEGPMREDLDNIKASLRGVASAVAPLEVRLLTTPEVIEESHGHAGS